MQRISCDISPRSDETTLGSFTGAKDPRFFSAAREKEAETSRNAASLKTSSLMSRKFSLSILFRKIEGNIMEQILPLLPGVADSARGN